MSKTGRSDYYPVNWDSSFVDVVNSIQTRRGMGD
jgi:hypothetical protein